MPNYDEKTGIAYGVSSPNALNGDALNDIYANGNDPHYENGKEELIDDLKAFCENHNIRFDRINTDSFIDEFSDSYQGNDDGQCDYSDNDYDLHVSGDGFGIFVMKSPYYTYCRKCSPCAPGAGDLNHPVPPEFWNDKIEYPGQWTDLIKAYCLDKSFFDDDCAKIPYRVFRVDNDQEVV